MVGQDCVELNILALGSSVHPHRDVQFYSSLGRFGSQGHATVAGQHSQRLDSSCGILANKGLLLSATRWKESTLRATRERFFSSSGPTFTQRAFAHRRHAATAVVSVSGYATADSSCHQDGADEPCAF